MVSKVETLHESVVIWKSNLGWAGTHCALRYHLILSYGLDIDQFRREMLKGLTLCYSKQENVNIQQRLIYHAFLSLHCEKQSLQQIDANTEKHWTI